MGSNLTERAAQHAARSVSTLHEFTRVFDQTYIPFTSSTHTTKSDKDVEKVVTIAKKPKFANHQGA